MIPKFDVTEFKRGALSAVASIAICYPFQKISIRQALNGVTIINAIRGIQREGYVGLYRGIGPPLIQKTLGISMMYGIFQTFKNLYQSLFPELNTNIISIMAGFTSGIIETIMTPFERIQTLLSCPSHSLAINDTFSCVKYIKRVYPFKEFYRGWQPIMLRNCLSTCLFFIIRDAINNCFSDNEKYVHLKNFITGAFLGSVLSTLCFPINSSKIYMQGQLGAPYISFNRSVKKLFEIRNRNIRNLYIGSGVNAFRSLISWGIINTIHEYLAKNNYFS